MARNSRSIKVSALNIAMHQPHSPQLYMALFRDALKLKALVPLGSLHGAMLGSLGSPREYRPGVIMTGEVYRFVKIDSSEPWFNSQTKEVASDDDMGKVQIPKHLLPQLQFIEFVFLPDSHSLWFVSQDRKDRLGPLAAAKFFQALFDKLHVENKCSQVEVTALPDKDTLENLLSLHKLERITIRLKRPNADDAAGVEARLLKRLQDQNIRQQETAMVAAVGESIKPDADTRALAEVAARNGSVSVIGKDADGLRVDESTVYKPMVLTSWVNSAIETSMDVLKRVATGR